MLAFSRDVETAIYNNLPSNLERLFRRHPLKCAVAFIGGLGLGASARLPRPGLEGLSALEVEVASEHVERLAAALHVERPRRATKPTRGAKERRLKAKKERSQTKANRKPPRLD